MPAPESTTMTPSMTSILTALSREHGATVTELTQRAGLGRSTTARVLTALESKGLARRERTQRTIEHRPPEKWFATAPATTEGEDAEATPDNAAETTMIDSEPDRQRPSASSTTAAGSEPLPTAQAEPDAESADRNANEHTGNAPEKPGPDATPENEGSNTESREGPQRAAYPGAGDAAEETELEVGNEQGAPNHTVPAAAAATQTHETASSPTAAEAAADHRSPVTAPSEAVTPRLAKGGLRALVEGHLIAHPDEEFTASKLGKILTRSGGAIANALDTLIKNGQAEMTSEKPRTFRYASKTDH